MEPHRGARTLRTALIVIIALLVSSRLDFLTGNLPLYPPLTSLSRFFSFLGDGAFLIPLSVFLYLLGRSLDKGALKRAGAHSLFSIIASGAVVHILKAAFERPRVAHTAGHMIKLLENPTLFDLTGRYNSFPSGHSTVGFAVAFILGRTYPSLRLPLYAVAALIAASRVYLGSHYPSDVAAGAALGLGLGYVISNGKDLLKGNEKLLWAGILLLAVFVSFFKTGGFLLFDVDEAVFSEASREMLLTGDYLTPTYNFEPRYDKPILMYWFMSLSFALFGVTEFAARLPSSGFGVGLALVTFSFVRRFSGVKEAVFSTLVLLLNLEFFVYSHSAVTDMPLAFFISGSLFSFYAAVKTGERKFHALFWVSSALAVLTKGAIGLVFPLAISLVHLAATRDLAAAKRFLRPAYIILFLVVAVPWFAAEYHLRGWEFIDAFIIKHHIKRYTGVISSHSGPFYYYALILMAGLYPWVAFLPGAVYRGVLRRGGDENADLGLFLSIWFLLILVFFSAASTKLPNYILPLVPAASVLAGLSITGLMEKGKPGRGGRGGRGGLYIMAVLSLVLSIAFFAIPSADMKMDITFPALYFHVLGAVFLSASLLSLAALKKPLPSIVGLGFLTVVILVFLRLFVVPPVNIFLQKDLYTYSTYARGLGEEAILATYEVNRPSIAFYSGKRIIKIEKNNIAEMEEYLDKVLLIITEKENYTDLAERYELVVLGAGGEFMLLSNTFELPVIKPIPPPPPTPPPALKPLYLKQKLDFLPPPNYPFGYEEKEDSHNGRRGKGLS